MHGQWFDNLVQFDIWASNGRTAEQRAVWFQRTMELLKGTLMRQGVQKLAFWSRLEDDTITKWRSDIAVRSLRYYVRTEELQLIRAGKIQSVDVYANVQYDLREDEDELAKAMDLLGNAKIILGHEKEGEKYIKDSKKLFEELGLLKQKTGI